ncbi:hypothetical protein PANA5342_pPANA10166 (plasmid) [Pantoea ananatis LMG 5342]|nr:hypothetical protein PANA5342_pPANA10166 [Pantoea ananatis LMG 5342]
MDVTIVNLTRSENIFYRKQGRIRNKKQSSTFLARL